MPAWHRGLRPPGPVAAWSYGRSSLRDLAAAADLKSACGPFGTRLISVLVSVRAAVGSSTISRWETRRFPHGGSFGGALVLTRVCSSNGCRPVPGSLQSVRKVRTITEAEPSQNCCGARPGLWESSCATGPGSWRGATGPGSWRLSRRTSTSSSGSSSRPESVKSLSL